MNAKDIDPGISNYTRYRRIFNRIQLRNELLYRREMLSDTAASITIASTNTAPEAITTIREVRDLHISEGYKDVQFHYLILENGQLITGLEVGEVSNIASGIVVALAGGLNSQGEVPSTKRTSLYTQKQIESLMHLLTSYVTLYEDVSLLRSTVIRRAGMGPAQLNIPELFQTVLDKVLRGTQL